MNPISSISAVFSGFIGYFASALAWLAGSLAFAGTHRWALAIVIATLIVRTALLPVAIKQIRSMREQQRLMPEMQRLKQKYARDRQKQTEELMALYRREGVNPYAACLPLIAQMPIMIAMYRSIFHLTSLSKEVTAQLTPIALKMHISVAELARQRGIIPRMPFLGLGDLAHPAISSIAGVLLILIMTGSQLFATWQLNPGATDQQKRMQYMMPFMFVFIMLRWPAALALYWATQQMYQTVQQMVMTRGWSPSNWLTKPEPAAKGAKKTPVTAPQALSQRPASRPPASPPQTFGSAFGQGVGASAARRELAAKRKRRRKKKRRK